GATILLGLPIGRLRRSAPTLRMTLNGIAVGILIFLVWDVFSAAWEPIDEALGQFHDGNGGLGKAFGYGALFVAGLTLVLLGLVFYERWMERFTDSPDATLVNGTPAPEHGFVSRAPAPAHVSVVAQPAARSGLAAWSPARRLALLIAVGIGLHN